MNMLGLLLLTPVLGAAILALLPRLAPWLLLLFALAEAALCGMVALGQAPVAITAGAPASAPGGSIAGVVAWLPGLQLDAISRPFVLLAGAVGLIAACAAFGTVPHLGWSNGRLRGFYAALQLLLAALLLALVADNLAVGWMAMEAATLAVVVLLAAPRHPAAIEAAWKFFVLAGVGVALALFGMMVLALAIQPALAGAGAEAGQGFSFTAMLHAAPRADPAALNLAFLLVLVGYGSLAGLVPLHSWVPDAHAEAPAPVAVLLSGLVLPVALHGVLRAEAVVGANPQSVAPGHFLLALGALSVLLAGLSQWRRRDAGRLLAWNSVAQTGLAACAFGLGGAGGAMAGLVQLLGHALMKAGLFCGLGQATWLRGSRALPALDGLCRDAPGLGWGMALGLLALVGAPPFVVFFAEFLLLAQTAAQPWLLLVLLPGLLLGGIAVALVLQRLCFAPAPGPAGQQLAVQPAHALALLALWLSLGVSMLLGLAMPGPLAAMLRAASAVLA